MIVVSLKEEPMMKNNKLGSLFWILLVVCILNIVGHLAVYPALPDTVPIHSVSYTHLTLPTICSV